MNDRIRTWIFVLLLGAVLPGILLKVLPGAHEIELTPNVQDASSSQDVKILLQQVDGSVEDIPLEEYVLGVVLAEMPASFELEALKAQAVLSRTYALRHAATDKHEAGALCTVGSCCQAYITQEAYLQKNDQTLLDKVRSAVDATKGQVLMYENVFIDATYFSCSGGRTEDAADVWGQEVPYLKATESPGEEASRHYVTTVTMALAEFEEKLGVDFAAGGINPPVYTAGGGIQTVSIGGQAFTGVELRKLLGLKSTAIRMTVVGEKVIITTKGYGHRVGMSQYGADAMAVSGSTYEDILMHYYRDVTLTEYKP